MIRRVSLRSLRRTGRRVGLRAIRRAATACLLLLLATACARRDSLAQQPPEVGTVPAGFAAVVINELLPHTDPPEVDSVELYNQTQSIAQIGGWCLSDTKDELCRYRFPDDATIAPLGYRVVTQDEWSRPPVLKWGLSEMGETVLLSQAAPAQPPSGYQHRIEFGATANGVAVGRVVTSDGREFFPPLQSITLGGPNAAPAVGPVVIAEVMYDPADVNHPEYLELLNTGDQSVPLSDPLRPQNTWLVDGVGKFYLPQGIELAPDESLFVTQAAPDAFRAAYGLGPAVQVAGPYNGSLDDMSDQIAVLRPDTPNEDGSVPYLVVDSVDYTNGAPWPVEPAGQGPALERAVLDGFGQEPNNWRASTMGLESDPAVEVVTFEQWPQLSGGRLLQWRTAQEWRSLSFRILRSDTGLLNDAQQVGAETPSAGGRHAGFEYALADPGALQEGSYRYWLEWTSEEGARNVGMITAGPWRVALLPVARRD